jgi:hypothetical protein
MDLDQNDSAVEPSEFDDDVSSNRSVSITSDAPTTFHDFSRLPTEIRLMIWELVLDEPKRIVVLFDRNPRVQPPNALSSNSRIVYDFTVRILGFILAKVVLRNS